MEMSQLEPRSHYRSCLRGISRALGEGKRTSEVSVPYWPKPQIIRMHMCTSTMKVTSEAMRLPLPLLLLFGCRAIPGSLGDRPSLSATAPKLDDEEKYSSHMPAHLRCDACRAVAYQMGQHLAKAEAKSHAPDSSELQELSESIYTDVLDRTCSQNWQLYGVQEVNQMKRLMGPGLNKGPEPSISVMITGGPWPNRLSMTCFHYLGEFGEDQIYEAYRQGHEALQTLLCGGTRGACSKEVPAPREEL